MTDDEFAYIMDLDAHASPGPWYVHFTDDSASANAVYVSVDGPEGSFIEGKGLAAGSPDQVDPARIIAITLLQYPELAVVGDERWDVNARFIAVARTLLPRLASEVMNLRREIERLCLDSKSDQDDSS